MNSIENFPFLKNHHSCDSFRKLKSFGFKKNSLATIGFGPACKYRAENWPILWSIEINYFSTIFIVTTFGVKFLIWSRKYLKKLFFIAPIDAEAERRKATTFLHEFFQLFYSQTDQKTDEIFFDNFYFRGKCHQNFYWWPKLTTKSDRVLSKF